jgi:hypothetical protein
MSSLYVFDKNLVLSRHISMSYVYVLYPAAVIVTDFVTQMIYTSGTSYEGRQLVIFFIILLSPAFQNLMFP